MGNFIRQLLGTPIKSEGLVTALKPINAIANSILGILGLGILAVAIYIGFKFFTAEDEDKRKNAKGKGK